MTQEVVGSLASNHLVVKRPAPAKPTKMGNSPRRVAPSRRPSPIGSKCRRIQRTANNWMQFFRSAARLRSKAWITSTSYWRRVWSGKVRMKFANQVDTSLLETSEANLNPRDKRNPITIHASSPRLVQRLFSLVQDPRQFSRPRFRLILGCRPRHMSSMVTTTIISVTSSRTTGW